MMLTANRNVNLCARKDWEVSAELSSFLLQSLSLWRYDLKLESKPELNVPRTQILLVPTLQLYHCLLEASPG